MALITCRNVAFAYEGNTVVKDLNFDVQFKDYLCIVGENGSGKSTLMKGLLRLLRPDEGTIELGEGLRFDEIGYLPQQTAAQKDFPASVYEVVLSGRLGSRGIRPFYSKEDKQVAGASMELLGISEIKKRCYRELSGGQQQRVLLCRALCATKRLLLLDEPSAGLDPLVTQDLYKTVRLLNSDTNLTVIMISHDIHAAIEHASHILHIKNRQAFFGSVMEYVKTDYAKGFLGGEADG